MHKQRGERESPRAASLPILSLDNKPILCIMCFSPAREGRAHEASWRGAGPVPAPGVTRTSPVRAASRHGRAAPLWPSLSPSWDLHGTGAGRPGGGSTPRGPIPRQLRAERALAHPGPGGSGQEWGRRSYMLCRTPAGRQGAGILHSPRAGDLASRSLLPLPRSGHRGPPAEPLPKRTQSRVRRRERLSTTRRLPWAGHGRFPVKSTVQAATRPS